jgi:Fic family protein
LLDQLPLCLRLIRELHAKLLEGVRGAEETPGEFRLIQNFIGHDDLHSARFVPPPASYLEPLLRDLEQFLNEGEAPESPPLLVRIALAHYQFETIHPFRDGNGRVGRLLIPLTLQAHARLSSPTLYLSGFFEQHKREYVDLMLAVSQRGEFEPWVQFFLQAVQEAAQESIDKVTHLLELRDRYHNSLQTARSPALTLKLVDRLFELPIVTVASAAKELEVTPATATQHVQRLVEAKILVEVTGRKRDRQYFAPELLQALGTEQE